MFIEVEGTKLHYERMGEGMPIIIFHGHSVDYRLMSGPIEQYFGREDAYQRIYFDIPGMGESQLNDSIGSWEDLKRLFLQAIRELIGDQKCLMMGESFGAYLVRGLVSAIPEQVEGIGFVCPWIPDLEQKLPERVITVKEPGTQWEDHQYDYFTGIAVQWKQEVWRRYQEEIEPGILLFDRHFDDLKNELTVDAEAVFDKPAVFMMGRQDHCAGYEAAFKLMEKYPRATYAIVDSCGHNMQIESDGVFEALMKNWLKRVEEFHEL